MAELSEVIKRSIVPAGREHSVTEWLHSEGSGTTVDVWTDTSLEAHEFKDGAAEAAVARVRERQRRSGAFAIVYVAPWKAGEHPELPAMKTAVRPPARPSRAQQLPPPRRIVSAAQAERDWQEQHDS